MYNSIHTRAQSYSITVRYLRVPDFSSGSYKRDIHFYLPDTPGWQEMSGLMTSGTTYRVGIASMRDVSTALLGVDDVELSDTPTLPREGDSLGHLALLDANGLTNGTCLGTITVEDVSGIASSKVVQVTLIVTDDYDNDGLPNDWELLYSGSITGILPSANSDTDLYLYGEEYTLGYNPLSDNAEFSPEVAIDGSIHCTFGESTNARLYSLNYTTNLIDWTAVTNVPGSNGATTVSLPDEGHDSGAFQVKVSVP